MDCKEFGVARAMSGCWGSRKQEEMGGKMERIETRSRRCVCVMLGKTGFVQSHGKSLDLSVVV